MTKLEIVQRIPKLRAGFRFSLLAVQLMQATSKRLNLDSTAVVEDAIRMYAREVLGPRRYREIERGVENYGMEMYEEAVSERESKNL